MGSSPTPGTRRIVKIAHLGIFLVLLDDEIAWRREDYMFSGILIPSMSSPCVSTAETFLINASRAVRSASVVLPFRIGVFS